MTLWSCYTSKEVLVEGKVLESSGVCVQDWLGVRSQREGHPVPGVAVTWVSGYPWGTGWVQGEEEALGQDASALGVGTLLAAQAQVPVGRSPGNAEPDGAGSDPQWSIRLGCSAP